MAFDALIPSSPGGRGPGGAPREEALLARLMRLMDKITPEVREALCDDLSAIIHRYRQQARDGRPSGADDGDSNDGGSHG